MSTSQDLRKCVDRIINLSHRLLRHIYQTCKEERSFGDGELSQSGEENSTGNRPKPDGDSYGDDKGGDIPR